jgi:hypothetical protein
MKYENKIFLCIAILLLAYLLFSGVIIESVNEYTKGTQGTTCDNGKQIDSKKECEDAIKSLELESKEWYNDYSEKMPGGCSWTEGENGEKANWNKSVKGAGLAGTFPICIAANDNISPEEAEVEFSKRARTYLRGISDQISNLGKARNKKRRTPVNISIDVGAGPGKTQIGGGDEEPPNEGGPVLNSPPPAGQHKKLGDAERGIAPEEPAFNSPNGQQSQQDGDCYDENHNKLSNCQCDKSCGSCGYGAAAAIDLPIDCITCKDGSTVNKMYADGTGCCGRDCVKQWEEAEEQQLEDAEQDSVNPPKKEAFSLPPTLGFLPQRNRFEGFLEGKGNPEKDDFGLRSKSKNSGDIRNYSVFGKKENPTQTDKFYIPFGPPIKQDGQSLNCSINDHRGCRRFGNRIKNIDKKRNELKKAADNYNKSLKTNFTLELKNFKANKEANKEVYEKKMEKWKEKNKNLEKESGDAKNSEQSRLRKEEIEIEKDLQEQEEAALNQEINNQMEEELVILEKAAKRTQDRFLHEDDAKRKIAKLEGGQLGKKLNNTNPKKLNSGYRQWGKQQDKTSPEKLGGGYRQWGGAGQQGQRGGGQPGQRGGGQPGQRAVGQQQGQLSGSNKPRHGIKQIVYDRNQMISPKLQKELGIGVHNTGDAPKHVIRGGPNNQSWYAWLFGEPKKVPKTAWY